MKFIHIRLMLSIHNLNCATRIAPSATWVYHFLLVCFSLSIQSTKQSNNKNCFFSGAKIFLCTLKSKLNKNNKQHTKFLYIFWSKFCDNSTFVCAFISRDMLLLFSFFFLFLILTFNFYTLCGWLCCYNKQRLGIWLTHDYFTHSNILNATFIVGSAFIVLYIEWKCYSKLLF